MWQSWRKLREPWRELPGWEYDLLRALPPATARALYQRAMLAVLPQMWRSRTHWFLFGVSLITFTLTTVLVWVVGAALGFGPIGRFFLELAFHGTFGVAILHTLARRYEEQMRPYVRAALADELMGYAEDILAPPTPRPTRPRRPVERRVTTD